MLRQIKTKLIKNMKKKSRIAACDLQFITHRIDHFHDTAF